MKWKQQNHLFDQGIHYMLTLENGIYFSNLFFFNLPRQYSSGINHVYIYLGYTEMVPLFCVVSEVPILNFGF